MYRLSESYQTPKSTGHPSVGRRNEYRPKSGDALRLGVKADMVLFAGNPVGVCIDALYKSTVSTYSLLYM